MASPEKSMAFEKKITKQIEYYFGDKNLPRDKFLLQKIEEDDGWVTMDCLLTFSRLKTIVHGMIGDALRANGSGLIEVDETNTKLRRTKPVPEMNDEYNLISKEKTIYCKGFPETTTLDEIEEFFEDKGKCVNISMRRIFGEKKTFKGSVFAEFATKEEANAFVARKDLKFKDNELTYMSKSDYFNAKFSAKKEKTKNGKKQSEGEQNKTTDEEEKEDDDKYPRGRVIHFSGAGDQTSREDIKEIFNLEGYAVKWVNFSIGDKEGFVRYANDGDAEKAMKALLEKHENKVTLRDEETTLRVVEGDEEKDYWKKVREDMDSRRNKKGGKKPYRHGNMKRGRKDSQTNDEPAAKQAKSDS